MAYLQRVLLLALCLAPSVLRAHVGSPDIYAQGQAGPYSVFVTVRPPAVIPGVAQVELRVLSGNVRSVRLAPLPLTGLGKNYPPVPDVALRDQGDPTRFTGSLWLMAFGSFEVRLDLDGGQGHGTFAVPVPAVSTRVYGMQKNTGLMLLGFLLFLVIGLVSIVGAAFREARLDAGLSPTPRRWRQAWGVMGGMLVFCGVVLWLGNWWWSSEAANYRRNIYKPLDLAGILQGNQLHLQLHDPGWLKLRVLDDLAPDHGHLMHLFLVRLPGLDRMAHLHPDMVATGRFTVDLPTLEAGRYNLYADIVHDNGLAETAMTTLDLPAITGTPVQGDDSLAVATPLKNGADSSEFPLEPGIRMVWTSPTGEIRAKRPELFTFEVHDSAGDRTGDLEPYMGMAGHAEFIRSDGQVFAHVHPSGSAAMTSMLLAQTPAGQKPAEHDMSTMTMPQDLVFPYGIPSGGRYRVFVQIKRHGEIRTAYFDFSSYSRGE